MSIGTKILERMQQQIEVEGVASDQARPTKVALREGPIRVEAEISAYDTLGVAVHALTMWGNNDASLQTLAKTISERVTYLWEPLALIERDLEHQTAQMRSAPPLVEETAIEFYEGELSRQDGTLRMRLVRYRQENGERRRTGETIKLTHEAFRRLVDDMAGILRAPQSE